jgi:deoxycytidylate deaminase
MNNKDNKMFKIAKEVATMSDFPRIHVGAVVTEGKTIISTGYNSYKTNPIQHRYNKYRILNNYDSSIAKEHAEIHALSRLIGKNEIDWTKVSIYIYREKNDGLPACSRPCPACMKLIKDLNIKNIYFIDENNNFCKERSL